MLFRSVSQSRYSVSEWAALSANPSLLTEVNGQSVTAAQATDIINNFKQGGNLALSNRSSVFGINSKAVATGATAIGLNSVADEANTVSVGRAGATKRITNVATPVNATDATNKAYVDTALSNFTANADTVLYDTASNQATLTLAGASGTKIPKLSAELISEKESIKRKYAEIGKAYYEAFKNEPKEFCLQQMTEITIPLVS